MKLDTLLREQATRFATEFDSFEVFQFYGTASELNAALAVWPKPAGVEIEIVDVADWVADAENMQSARARIDDWLKTLASSPQRSLIVLNGVHILSVVYGHGFIQAVIGLLRRGSRALILVCPPLPDGLLPTTATLSLWRAGIREFVGTDHEVSATG